MKISEITEVIASRVLKAGDVDVLVLIGKPAMFEDGNDYYCPFSIEGFGKTQISYAGGSDAVQALQLAMKKIGVELEYLGKKNQISISWLNDMPGETGFPL